MVKISQLHKTNGVLFRLVTAPHEVGECANLVAGLKEVENEGCLLVPAGLVKSREICGAIFSDPPQVVDVDGSAEASKVGN